MCKHVKMRMTPHLVPKMSPRCIVNNQERDILCFDFTLFLKDSDLNLHSVSLARSVVEVLMDVHLLLAVAS